MPGAGARDPARPGRRTRHDGHPHDTPGTTRTGHGAHRVGRPRGGRHTDEDGGDRRGSRSRAPPGLGDRSRGEAHHGRVSDGVGQGPPRATPILTRQPYHPSSDTCSEPAGTGDAPPPHPDGISRRDGRPDGHRHPPAGPAGPARPVGDPDAARAAGDARGRHGETTSHRGPGRVLRPAGGRRRAPRPGDGRPPTCHTAGAPSGPGARVNRDISGESSVAAFPSGWSITANPRRTALGVMHVRKNPTLRRGKLPTISGSIAL